ncbi:MAG TPA: TlpA disulfide reductase family protein [Planctomycetaceae bacterium]|jgi:thiol-disulfide isomerase/thioredoxin|nr:TlpA disulfide reductase family protein [Planctomycetaceae bacterium]
MSKKDRPSPAPRSSLLLMCVVAVAAWAIAGCTGQESSATSSTASVSAAKNPPQASVGEATAATPSRPTAASETTSTAVTVEPASPEELKKFIASQRGKVVLVDFWATYCLPCREKFPRTLALAKKYGDQGLTAISMSMDSPEPSYQKQIREFLQKQNSEIKNFANRLEDTDAAFAALDIVGGALPHYKIYSRDGKVRKQFGGDPDHPFAEADIEQAVVAALKDR